MKNDTRNQLSHYIMANLSFPNKSVLDISYAKIVG